MTSSDCDSASHSDGSSGTAPTEQTCLLAPGGGETSSSTIASSFRTTPSGQGCFDARCTMPQCFPNSSSSSGNANANANANNSSQKASESASSTSTVSAQPRPYVDGLVNYSTNTLLVYRLQDMRSNSNTNLFLAVLCLVYLGVNVTLCCVNYVNWKFTSTHPHSEEENEPVDDTVYHLVEFWGTFCFAIVECVALAVTPKSQYSINGNLDPLYLRMVMFVNIVATSVPAVMISFSLETFEILSHEIEYVNELTMSFVDVILLVSLWRSRRSQSQSQSALAETVDSIPDGWLTTGIAVLVAMVQLGVYNLMGHDEETGDMIGEVPGHFLEFAFEVVSSLIAFWFCMDNKAIADKEIGMILYGVHQDDCQICENQATQFAMDYRTTNNYNYNNNTIAAPPVPVIPQQAMGRPPLPVASAASSYYYQAV